jgi:hypothetical protein
MRAVMKAAGIHAKLALVVLLVDGHAIEGLVAVLDLPARGRHKACRHATNAQKK